MTNETPPPPSRRSLKPLPPMPPLETSDSWRALVESRIPTIRPDKGAIVIGVAAFFTISFSSGCAAEPRPATLTDTWSYELSDRACVDDHVTRAEIDACRQKLRRDTCAQLEPPCQIPEPRSP